MVAASGVDKTKTNPLSIQCLIGSRTNSDSEPTKLEHAAEIAAILNDPLVINNVISDSIDNLKTSVISMESEFQANLREFFMRFQYLVI